MLDPRLCSSRPMVPEIMKLIDPRKDDVWTDYKEHFFEEGASGKKGRIVKIRMPEYTPEIFPTPLRIVSIPLDKESYGKGIYTQYDNTMTEKSKKLFKAILSNTTKFKEWVGRIPDKVPETKPIEKPAETGYVSLYRHRDLM